jgi:RHS repeat-associated protein
MRTGVGWRRPTAAVLGGLLVATLLVAGADATPASTVDGVPSKPQKVPSVPGKAAPVLPRPADPASAAALRAGSAPAVVWPVAGSAEVTVGPAGQPGAILAGGLAVAVAAPPPVTAAADAERSVAATPVVTAAPTKVRLEVLDRTAAAKAGVTGVVLRLRRTDGKREAGPVSVSVDYSGFRGAYGGDWAARLRLVRLDGGSQTALPSRNDLKAGTVSAVLPAGPTDATFAVTAAPSGSTGDYTATSLSPSGTWQVSASSGTFTWSYGLRTLPVPGELAPELAATYSSAGADGRVVSTNNQPSWLGEGWDLGVGFIERGYKACADDMDSAGHNNTEKTGDLCWETDNATMSLGGQSGKLVFAGGNSWRPERDDGSRIERLTGSANGDNDGEHWKVTTTDGTQYFFGRRSDSAWTVPVFGNDPGEPCQAAGSFANSHCAQAWRWNLDYVVDTHGNTIHYIYNRETNLYALNLGRETASYTRGGTLARVEYGTRAGQTGTPPAKVVFEVADRCVPGADCAVHTAASWPDVPWDQACAAAPCGDKYAPTFWSTKRLTKVTSYAGGTAVDSWTFDHSYPAPGDGTSPALWLAGTSIALPPVTFDGTAYPNRVNSAEDGLPPLDKYRIHAINLDSGGTINVKYADSNCTAGNRPAPDTNSLRCFPVRWAMPPAPQPRDDWFHKYVVAEVSQVDQVGAGLRQLTTYEYVGGGAWHYVDDPLIPAERRTWSEWRGYEKVYVRRGDPVAEPDRPQSETLYQYFRGMNGDRLAAGGAKSVSVVDSAGVSLPDDNPYAGFPREEITNNGVGGPVVSGTIHDPWKRGPTATQDSLQAWQVEDVRDVTRTALSAGGFRRTEVQTTYNNEGNPTKVNDLGDLATADDDDQCTRTTYARNTNSWLLNLPSRVETVGVACTSTPSFPADAISDVRTSYDGGAWAAAPTAGDPTRVERVASYSGGTPSYQQVSRATYDAYGRVFDAFDALDRKTSTRYADSGGLNTSRTVTNPLGHTVTTSYEPAWGGLPASVVDANQRRIDLAYDGLGRLTKVWKPGRSKTAGYSPNLRFAYGVRNDGPSWVKTDTLNASASTTTTYALLDGFLRPRQTQAPSAQGGRVLTDILYDSRGLTYVTRQPYYNNDSGPGTTLLLPDDNQVPNRTVVRFDGAERPVASFYLKLNVEQWHTTTAYGGDHVDVTPPAGGTATTTWSDARGRTTELWQYHAGTPSGAHDTTRYSYTKAGQLATVTDPANNTWRYGYDVRGRKFRADDPDKGVATMTYDDADQLLTVTDARGQTIAGVYDLLGRKVEAHRDSADGPLLAKWTYDTLLDGTVEKGRLTSSTRYVNGNGYTRAVAGFDAAGRPTGENVIVPASEGPLAGTYATGMTYRADDSPASTSLPALGNLPAETLVFDYDTQGLLSSMQGASKYVAQIEYTALNERSQVELGTVGKRVWQTTYYEEGTRRLDHLLTEREQAGSATVDDLSYAYDPAGNVTRITDALAGAATDTQCFSYDYLRRVTQAWTQSSDGCADAPSTSVIGGPAPYWHSFTYDLTGNRATQTRHGLGGAADSVSTYTYPAAGTARPHAVQSVQTTGPGAGTASYTYDETGNTTSRPGPTGAQTLSWDAEGLLAAAGDSSYVYDADGRQLLRRDPGSVTLFVGNGELRLDTATGTKKGTRYYQGLGMRTSAGMSYLLADHHGTAQLAIDSATLAATPRRFDPFGNPRGPAPATWPGGERAFVGGTANPATGLTRLGAREYDPALGKFLSVDPVIDPADPQQLNAYAYANNNPVTMSDPDGRFYYVDVEGRVTIPSPARASSNAIDRAETKARQIYGGRQGTYGKASTTKTLPHGTRVTKVHTNRGDLTYINGILIDPNHVSDIDRFAELFDEYFSNGFHSQMKDLMHRTASAMSAACETPGGPCDGFLAAALKHLVAAYAMRAKGCNERCQQYADFIAGIAMEAAATGAGQKLGPVERLSGAPGSRPISSFLQDLVCLHSFRADTQVLMADGSSKPIGKIKLGDKVKATDPRTGKTVTRTVTALHHNRDSDLVDVTVTDARGRVVVLHTTQHHPFWDDSQGRWVEAGSLRPGERLHTRSGAAATVAGVRSFAGSAEMHDLTVDDVHTFYVQAGDTPVLVHNAPPKGCGLTSAADAPVIYSIARGSIWRRMARSGLTSKIHFQASRARTFTFSRWVEARRASTITILSRVSGCLRMGRCLGRAWRVRSRKAPSTRRSSTLEYPDHKPL